MITKAMTLLRTLKIRVFLTKLQLRKHFYRKVKDQNCPIWNEESAIEEKATQGTSQIKVLMIIPNGRDENVNQAVESSTNVPVVSNAKNQPSHCIF